jgi:hypothetical protein
MGGTNVVEYAPGQGLVWYLKDDRGTDGQGLVGAGVTTVTADADGAVATRTSDTSWGSTEPHWGDVGVTYNASDGKVYVYGYGPDPYGVNVYLARADGPRATDVSAYEYWDQSSSAWTPLRFSLSGAFGTVKLSDAQALFTNRTLGQSNAFWSNYYNTWMFVAGADVGYTDIMVMTAPALEGPWTQLVTIASTCPDNSCVVLAGHAACWYAWRMLNSGQTDRRDWELLSRAHLQVAQRRGGMDRERFVIVRPHPALNGD